MANIGKKIGAIGLSALAIAGFSLRDDIPRWFRSSADDVVKKTISTVDRPNQFVPHNSAEADKQTELFIDLMETLGEEGFNQGVDHFKNKAINQNKFDIGPFDPNKNKPFKNPNSFLQKDTLN